MRAVRLPAGEYADGTAGSPWTNSGSQYRDAIGETCSQLATDMGSHTTVGAGDWLMTVPGEKVGDTEQGIAGQGKSAGLCGSDTCSPAVQVNVALWDTYGNAPHGNCSGCYHIKYMAAFWVTGYNKKTNSVTGYFDTLQEAGGFINSSGPLPKNALVQ
jgi:hypothetical protein